MSKNARNIRYAIITPRGFLLDEATGGTRQFHTAVLAMEKMSPGDQIIPIENETALSDYESGKTRLPTFNRHGR